MTALYNEHDHGAAAWLRELINQERITEGKVDERSIADLQPTDLAGFRRVHLFAGIGGWDLALAIAGWPADRPAWTGSCPCQPFSVAGKGKGTKDHRDLWPEMRRLIAACRPEYVFGEQVPGAIGHGWLDRVSTDMAEEGYQVGAVVLGAHSVGAPHIRQRLYWCAYRPVERREVPRRSGTVFAPESVAMEKTLKRICLSRESAGEHLHAPIDSRDDKGGWEHCGPHQSKQTGQQEGKSSGGISLGKQPQQGNGERRSISSEGKEKMECLPVDRQEVSMARVVCHEGRSDLSTSRSDDECWPDFPADFRVAYNKSQGRSGIQPECEARIGERSRTGSGSEHGGLAHTEAPRRQSNARAILGIQEPAQRQQHQQSSGCCENGNRPEHTQSNGRRERRPESIGGSTAGGCGDERVGDGNQQGLEGWRLRECEREGKLPAGSASPWSDYQLIHFRDGKTRRIKSGLEPLVDGLSGRVGLLRGYGNAIVPQVAAVFIKAVMELIGNQ